MNIHEKDVVEIKNLNDTIKLKEKTINELQKKLNEKIEEIRK